MNKLKNLNLLSVIFLTLIVFTTSSCSYIGDRYFGETCKTRAYLNRELESYLTNRFHKHAPIRLGIIPFSVPANLASVNSEHPGLGNKLAWAMHQEFLASKTVPIVEVLNRQDWPGKKEEFFTGNFGALQLSRAAGYDLVLVGYIESQKNLNQMTAQVKLIEVETGTSIWYGSATVISKRQQYNEIKSNVWLGTKRPDQFFLFETVDELAACVVEGIRADEEE